MAERVRRIALLLAGVALLAACGVPGAGRPVIDGDGPTRLGGRSDLSSGTPPGPDGITDARQLVGTYLQAAGGRAEDRDARLRAFFTDNQAQRWSSEGGEVLVVRAQVGAQTPTGSIATENGNQYLVDVVLTPVGVLDGRTGSLGAPRSVDPVRTNFRVVVNGMKARISAAPNGVLLDTDGLTSYYTPHTLYFWSAVDHVLVPDLRYLPSGLPPEQTVVDYLLAGPSDLLRPAVVAPLPGIEPIGRPAVNGGKLVINFPAKATAQLSDLMTQLRWSLRPDYTGPIDLQVVGNSTNVDSASTDYVAANPSTRRQDDPDQYAVYGGKVVPLEGGGPIPPQLPDVLRTPANAGVVSAAISRDKSNAAMVVDGPQGRELKILRMVKGTVSVTSTGVRGRNFSRPVFADGPAGFGVFVTVDGALDFVPAEGRPSRLRSPGLITYSAVSVAPDARRIAVVADGRLYVAPLALVAGRLEMVRPRLVDAGVTDLVAVAWTREERLVVAAAGVGNTLREVSVDGALVDQDMPNTRKISQLVAYADNPFEGDSRGQVMYQQGSTSFALWGAAYQSHTATGKINGVTAPFYLDYS